MENKNATNPPINPSKALTVLAKLNQMKERARATIGIELATHEKACKKSRFLLGQAILSDPALRKQLEPYLSESLKNVIQSYFERTAAMTALRASMPK